MSLFFNYIPAYITNWVTTLAYNLVYFVSWGQLLFIQHVQKPSTRLWNTVYLPTDNVVVEGYFPSGLSGSNNLQIKRFKKYCPIEEKYTMWDMVRQTDSTTDEPTSSNVRFLDMELHFTSNNNEDVEHSIALFTPTRNYYVVGNKICSTFIDYFMHTYHKDFVDQHDLTLPLKYTLTIVDHNINMVTLTEKDAIVLKEYDYSVLTSDSTLFKDDDSVSSADGFGAESTIAKSPSSDASIKSDIVDSIGSGK